MKKIAVFPGSFDPFTKGHFDVVERAARLFDEVVVAIGINSNKQRYFPIEYMIPKIQEAFRDIPQVRVDTYQTLTANYAKSIGAHYLVRGLRNTTDFEYENTIAQVNTYQWNELETIFLITDPKLAYISSSIVRELHRNGADVKDFLPYAL
ncbi:MAG: pantetheine-phosphate adenylyltransferase [Cytophagaceae bacterium]|jgi:pantetheine-phosphate adenylyltransferase|nr:pantetheine-phosphate adenylyltransferase [Cytophagaceae bacterium]